MSIFFVLCCIIWHQSSAQFDPTLHKNWNFLDNISCGTSETSRIIQGLNTNLGEFPWIVGIIHSWPNGMKTNMFVCSGSLLNKRIILTAAHCVTDLGHGKRVAEIVVGDWTQGKDLDCDHISCGKTQTVKPKEIIFHSRFNSEHLQNDISLIRLERDVELSFEVWPICLPKGSLMENDYSRAFTIGAGWGVVDVPTQEMSKMLLKVHLRVEDMNYCRKTLPNGYPKWDKQLCAFGKSWGSAVCHGDSGGPLMSVDSINGQQHFHIIGIVSYGRPTYCQGTPAIYTRVASYMEWILDNLIESKSNFRLA